MFVFVKSISLIKENPPCTLEAVDFDFVQEEMSLYIELENKSRIAEFAEKQMEREAESQKLSLEQQKLWDEQKRNLEE